VSQQQQPHASPSEPAALSLPLPLPSEEEEEPDPTLRRNAQNLLPIGETNVVGAEPREHAPHPTVEDFYKRLEGLESQAEQSTRMLVEVLASQRDQDVFLDELGDVVKELTTTVSQRADALKEARNEQTETRMDLQKVEQMVETAQRWAYISLAAILVWKVVGATWKRCTPVASLVGNSGTATAPRRDDQAHAAAPAVPVAEQHTKPGDPFFMA
ncbi:MAG: hypothetical protein AB2556_23660, partial [Candidatus Thiodiazotropha sp.]